MTHAAPQRRLVMCVFRCSYEDRERMRVLARYYNEPYAKILRDLIEDKFNTLPVDVRYTAAQRAIAEEGAHMAASAEGV